MKTQINGVDIEYQVVGGKEVTTINEMARVTGIKSQTIRQWVHRGQIEFVTLERMRLIPLSEVEKRMGKMKGDL